MTLREWNAMPLEASYVAHHVVDGLTRTELRRDLSSGLLLRMDFKVPSLMRESSTKE